MFYGGGRTPSASVGMADLYGGGGGGDRGSVGVMGLTRELIVLRERERERQERSRSSSRSGTGTGTPGMVRSRTESGRWW